MIGKTLSYYRIIEQLSCRNQHRLKLVFGIEATLSRGLIIGIPKRYFD